MTTRGMNEDISSNGNFKTRYPGKTYINKLHMGGLGVGVLVCYQHLLLLFEVVFLLLLSSMLLLQQDIFATEKALSVRLRSKLPAPRDLTRIKKQLNENGDRIRRFVSDFLHKAKYPLALDPICLIDEDWDPRKRPVTIHYVEGCVTDGVIVPWAISDVQYCRHKPTYLTVVGLPTALDEDVQMGVSIAGSHVKRELRC